MRFTDALYRGITSGRSPGTEGLSLGGVLAELEHAAGGGRHAARDAAAAAGVPGRTWRRWKAGANRPTPAGWGRLLDAQRRARLPRGREQWLRRDPGIGVHAIIKVSEDERERKVIISGWRHRPDSKTVLNRWLRRHDDAGAAAEIIGAMVQEIPGLEIIDTFAVRFFQRHGDAQHWARS